MDSFANPQTQDFKPYISPCPGCGQGPAMQGMPGMQGLAGQPRQSSAVPMTTPAFQSQLPTGVPLGPNYGTGPLFPGALPSQAIQPAGPAAPGSQDLAPIMPWNQPIPVTTESLQYMNGFMRTQIGRKVTVEFLIGTNTLVDKSGTLLAVGANYIIINEVETDDILLCDFYSIKFMRFYY